MVPAPKVSSASPRPESRKTDALVTLVSVPVTVFAASDTPHPAYSVPQNFFGHCAP